jgi:hypothetical protein
VRGESRLRGRGGVDLGWDFRGPQAPASRGDMLPVRPIISFGGSSCGVDMLMTLSMIPNLEFNLARVALVV